MNCQVKPLEAISVAVFIENGYLRQREFSLNSFTEPDLAGAYHLSSLVLCGRDANESNKHNTCPHKAYILWGKIDQK
jgi:hypothetical protein